jgi:hypothetical protein
LNIEHFESKGNVKNIKVIGKRGSVRIAFRHTLTDKSDKMIVDTVDYGQGPKRGWSEHGSYRIFY